MNILAIDPGNVTGVAFYNTGRVTRRAPPQVEEIPGGLYGFVEWWVDDQADGWPALYGPYDLILVEDFIIKVDTAKKTREPAAYELLGWIKGMTYVEQIKLDVIGPGQHTEFSGYKKKKTSKLVRLGWSNPSKDMHADSASSILLTGLKRHAKPIANQLLKEIATDVN